ncbi:MAG: HAD family hydrolase [Candidatus Hodarchaeota archaeon]
MTFTTLILDCDGVIVDSEPFSCKAWNVIFTQEYGLEIGADYEPILGKSTRSAAIHYLEKHRLVATESAITKLKLLKENAYLNLAEGNLAPIRGVEELIARARELGWQVAVASSGILSKIRFSLAQAGISESIFDAIVGSDAKEGLRGKPFPDIFLEAASKLTTNPESCVVVEDTPSGIESAKQAAMFVVGITTTFPRERLEQADLIVDSFNEIDLTRLA